MEDNHYANKRLSKEIEQVFFKSKENADTIAQNLVTYAEKVYLDPIDIEMEHLIELDPNAVVRYIKHLKSVNRNIRPELLNCLKGNSNCLAAASVTVGRLPSELEVDITHPSDFITYISNLKYKVPNLRSESGILEQEQKVFFSNKLSPEKTAEWVAKYANHVGVLPQEFKELLKADNDSILQYQSFLAAKNLPLDDDLRDCLAGDDKNLFKYAQNTRKRLPQHLEETLKNPQVLLSYARNIVQGRLPEELENHFASDLQAASNYAFEIIRGYASVRLPDVVHSAMILTNSANPNDYNIKRYVKECERDTTVPGSW
jgi:hypothetical protein